MTLEAHDPSVHPVECAECRRMNDRKEPNPMLEHYKSGGTKEARKHFQKTERDNRAARKESE